jgi:sarcosine oxidase subunit gamma
VLQKLCRLDLHPRAFGAGAAAATEIAHLACLVHQRDNTPRYDLHVTSSYAASFVAVLCEAAEEAGYVIEASP